MFYVCVCVLSLAFSVAFTLIGRCFRAPKRFGPFYPVYYGLGVGGGGGLNRPQLSQIYDGVWFGVRFTPRGQGVSQNF